MKKIVLSIGILLLLVQNILAKTDVEYDRQIANESDLTIKQLYRCNKVATNHYGNGNVKICIKALDMLKNNYPNEINAITATILNIGVLYKNQGDYINGYKYYSKAAKLGGKIGIKAQGYLSILCKENSWACK